MNKKALILVKIGGEVAEDIVRAESLLLDLIDLKSQGYRVVLCHGGGPQITRELGKRGIAANFVNGQRVTDAETLEVTCQVLLGEINRKLVAVCNKHGNQAVGLSGLDAGIYRADQRDPTLGFVGRVQSINTDIIETVINQGLIPIIACIGSDTNGQVYNINADSAAGELAKALKADSYLVFTNVEGLYRSFSDKSSLLKEIDSKELQTLMAAGALTEGMIPKIESILIALNGGVNQAVIVDGRKERAIKNTIEGKINGTVIRL